MQYSIINVSVRPEVRVQSGVVHVTRTRPSSLVNIGVTLTSLGADNAVATINPGMSQYDLRICDRLGANVTAVLEKGLFKYELVYMCMHQRQRYQDFTGDRIVGCIGKRVGNKC